MSPIRREEAGSWTRRWSFLLNFYFPLKLIVRQILGFECLGRELKEGVLGGHVASREMEEDILF